MQILNNKRGLETLETIICVVAACVISGIMITASVKSARKTINTAEDKIANTEEYAHTDTVDKPKDSNIITAIDTDSLDGLTSEDLISQDILRDNQNNYNELKSNYESTMTEIYSKIFAMNGAKEYTHTKSGQVHALKGPANAKAFTFVATESFKLNDSFTVNGEKYSGKTYSGETLGNNFFVKDSLVKCILINDSLYLYTDTVSSLITESVGGIYDSNWKLLCSLDAIPNAITINGETKTLNSNFSTYVRRNYPNTAYVVIPKGITVIGSQALRDLTYMKGVYMPDTIKEIQDNAFYNCSRLKDINLPKEIVTIGNSAFQNCTSLETVSYAPVSLKTIGSYAFYNCSNLICFYFDGHRSDYNNLNRGNYCFNNVNGNFQFILRSEN